MPNFIPSSLPWPVRRKKMEAKEVRNYVWAIQRVREREREKWRQYVNVVRESKRERERERK